MTEPLPPESPRQLQQWVMDRLRQDILEGRLAPGEWLRQERLARTFSVSHMPVREALKQLAAEGLLEHVPYKGVRVLGFSVEDVEDLYACRAFVEGRAARHAATRLTPAALATLRDLHQHMSACTTSASLETYRELNRAFHQTLYDGCDRAFLTRLLGTIWNAFPRMLWNSFAATAHTAVPGRETADTREHAAILQALEARDPEAVEHAIRSHIDAAGKELVAVLRRKETARA